MREAAFLESSLTHYLKRSCFLRKQLLAFVSSVLFSCVSSIFIGTFMILLCLKNAFVLLESFVPHYGSSVSCKRFCVFKTSSVLYKFFRTFYLL